MYVDNPQWQRGVQKWPTGDNPLKHLATSEQLLRALKALTGTYGGKAIPGFLVSILLGGWEATGETPDAKWLRARFAGLVSP